VGALVKVTVGGAGVWVGALVEVNVGVRLGGWTVYVRVGWRVSEGRKVEVGRGVWVEVRLASGVGTSPSMVNFPEIFHINPTKIWTSYSPGNQLRGEAAQAV